MYTHTKGGPIESRIGVETVQNINKLVQKRRLIQSTTVDLVDKVSKVLLLNDLEFKLVNHNGWTCSMMHFLWSFWFGIKLAPNCVKTRCDLLQNFIAGCIIRQPPHCAAGAATLWIPFGKKSQRQQGFLIGKCSIMFFLMNKQSSSRSFAKPSWS